MLTTTRTLPFFVYGTLRPTQPNHHLLVDDLVTSEPAAVEDVQLHDASAFPYATRALGRRVIGDLIDVDNRRYTRVLENLDRLEGFDADDPEGSHYVRVRCTAVLLADGQPRPAWIYLAGPLVDLTLYPRHPTGDWTAQRLHIARRR